MDEKELQKTIESFLENPFWAGYYDAAPSGAKEIIALEFYMSSSERAHNDPEAWSVLEECRAALETEDIDYLAENSPNPYERAFYRNRLQSGQDAVGDCRGETFESDAGRLNRVFQFSRPRWLI